MDLPLRRTATAHSMSTWRARNVASSVRWKTFINFDWITLIEFKRRRRRNWCDNQFGGDLCSVNQCEWELVVAARWIGRSIEVIPYTTSEQVPSTLIREKSIFFCAHSNQNRVVIDRWSIVIPRWFSQLLQIQQKKSEKKISERVQILKKINKIIRIDSSVNSFIKSIKVQLAATKKKKKLYPRMTDVVPMEKVSTTPSVTSTTPTTTTSNSSSSSSVVVVELNSEISKITTPTTPPTPVVKRSNFSISNLLAPSEEKDKEKEKNSEKVKIDEEVKVAPAPVAAAAAAAAAGVSNSPASQFLNASALAHLAHLHGSASGWDWLNGSANSDPQALWSRYAILKVYIKCAELE